MLRDESLEYIQEQFDEKNMVLGQFGEQVSSATLYEDIFNDLELVVPIVFISDDETTKHIVPMSIEEAIDQSQGRNDVLCGGATYFNNWISKKSAKDIYAFIIDMDNAYSGMLLNALNQDWYTAGGTYLPKPTYIVNSGTGLHLYFVLSEPIPNYKATTENLDKLYRTLAYTQTTQRVYLEKQVQWFGQDFRMAGGLNKYGWENTVFKIGEKWDIDDLGKAVGLNDVHFIRYGEKRKPKSYKKDGEGKSKAQRKGWKSKEAWYNYALSHCEEKTKEGNRYTSMCALTVIGWKCGIPIERVEQDLLSLLPSYNKGAKRIVKEKEVKSALKMYNSKAILTQRERLQDWQGWNYNPIPRNHRKRVQHLHGDDWVNEKGRPTVNVCKQNRELALAFMRENNQIKGRPPKQKELIQQWRRENPNGRKVDCHNETKINRVTINKWWDSVDSTTIN